MNRIARLSKAMSAAWSEVLQMEEFKFESKFEPLQVIWHSLLKGIPGGN